jgi:hypothetical protein
MNSSNSILKNNEKEKELVIDEDNLIQYKQNEIVKFQEPMSKQALTFYNSKQQSNQKKAKLLPANRIALFKHLTENREEFKKKITNETVLDEDEYLSTLEKIIQKDYFPTLYEKEQQKSSESVNGQSSIQISKTGNQSNLSSSLRNLEEINKEYLKERDKHLSKGLLNKKRAPEITENLSLDNFCANYTSDEQESLKEIIHKDKQRKLIKQFWMYECESIANTKLNELKDYSDEYNHVLADDKERYLTEDKTFSKAEIITCELDAKNSLFFHPDFSNTNNNSNRQALRPGDETEEVNSRSANLIVNKQVVKENTRLPQFFVESMMEKHSQKLRKRMFESYEGSDVVRLMKEVRNLVNYFNS